jgi:DNA-binding MarR family transcriptional regulator
MDYIRQLGPVVLDHRFRRLTETLLRAAEEIYDARGLPFRARWGSTYTLLHDEGSLAVGQIAERLRLTHAGVIGITDEMAAADIVHAMPDPADARRRLLELTDRGREMSTELFSLWKHLGEAQRKRFTSAGCDIMKVLDTVEESLVERPLSVEVLRKPNAKVARSISKARRVRAALTLIAAATIGAFAPVNPARAQDDIDSSTRITLVNALSDSLINGYIYEATGRKIADSLRAELKSGAYDGISTGDELARRINDTLRRISNDRHLGVQFMRAAGGGAPVRRRVMPGAPGAGSTDSGRRMVRVPSDAGIREASVQPKAISLIISAPETGMRRAMILDGNIGYLELTGFSGSADALAMVDSAMALFADAKAIIIDVGNNRGGGPPVIQHLSGYLFDKPVHLVSTFMRGMDTPSERWSAKVAGKRLPKTPVYVLTSRGTISAAESFAFGLKNHNRVTLIGERTAGGGHFGGFITVIPRFTVFLPRGRTYNPATNQGWEAEGLKPDIEVPYEKALETAIALARKP